MNTKRVSASAFSRFADSDLVRWRALSGQSVSPRDGRWGDGRAVEVRWQGRSDRPEDEGTIYVRVEYSGGLRVRVNARAFGRLHDAVELDLELAEFVERWFGGTDPTPGEEGELGTALAHWDSTLRSVQDAARERRAVELRRRAEGRRTTSSQKDIEA
jgi:hypothetical protein